MNPEGALAILRSGGYFERKNESKGKRAAPKFVTRLYDRTGMELGVANYARWRLTRLLKIREIVGPQNEQRWIAK